MLQRYRIILTSLAFLACQFLNAQQSPLNNNSEALPLWAQLMYTPNPNVLEVDRLYLEYYQTHTYIKTKHTQFYKRWRRAVNNYTSNDGTYDFEKKQGLHELLKARKKEYNPQQRAGSWSLLGPNRNLNPQGILSGAQVNVYSIGACKNQPAIMYCGTENGEIYKSLDEAETWFNVSYGIVPAVAGGTVIANAGFKAIAVHPTDPNIVYAGAGNEVYKTTDGGQNWSVVLEASANLFGYIETPSELLIQSSNPEIVFLTGQDGMYRTTDAGQNWSQILDSHCYDIKEKTDDPNTLFLVRKNNNQNRHEFLTSTDAGVTWTPQTTGWYNSTDQNRSVEGARLAVTEADPNRIYAYLIGNAKAGDEGFISIYASNDAGLSWYNTRDNDGAPYTDEQPNLIANSAGNYNQGFYNCAIMASNTDPDLILVGGIGMWRSEDAGQNYSCIYNYGCGNFTPMHVDMQDFRAINNTYWASTDGGIYRSEDLFASQPEFRMDGLHGVDYWGFGSGWNQDILVGGTFHNGVDIYYENYPSGDFLDIGYGEPASGYVNPGKSLTVYFTRHEVNLQEEIDGGVNIFVIGGAPNESPWFAESSEMLFHPDCYNHIYIGSENQVLKSIDGGINYEAIYFANSGALVRDLEISRNNPELMYAVIRKGSNSMELRKTNDDWQSSQVVPLPSNGANQNQLIISMDPEFDETIWIAYPWGNNGNKVFRSEDGGQTWTNETSDQMDFQTIQSIQTIGGTNGGVYVNTNVSCYYKNNIMDDFVLDNINLPLTISTRSLKPFYRDGKVRIASHGKGIWESPMYETPAYPLAKIIVDQLQAYCLNETFHFEDYSMLNHDGASWSWTFEGADISNSSLRNPTVTFTEFGNHLVTLEVTNNMGASSIDSLYINIAAPDYPSQIEEDFEAGFPPNEWTLEGSPWTYALGVGGYDLSDHSMYVDNFSISQEGSRFDIIAPVSLFDLQEEDALLSFDVAYAKYSAAYADSLSVSVSTDCGLNWTEVYLKGGTDLATAPDVTAASFIPEANQWRTDQVDLSAYLNEDNVQIKFTNINDYGQALYVDNINIGGTPVSLEKAPTSAEIQFYPNPVLSSGSIQFTEFDDEQLECSIYKSSGKLISNSFIGAGGSLDLSPYNLSPGIYTLQLRSSNKLKISKLVVVDRRD
jgi:photosystem II stability/assembly factor-like uncharacterized protein